MIWSDFSKTRARKPQASTKAEIKTIICIFSLCSFHACEPNWQLEGVKQRLLIALCCTNSPKKKSKRKRLAVWARWVYWYICGEHGKVLIQSLHLSNYNFLYSSTTQKEISCHAEGFSWQATINWHYPRCRLDNKCYVHVVIAWLKMKGLWAREESSVVSPKWHKALAPRTSRLDSRNRILFNVIFFSLCRSYVTIVCKR